MPDNNNDWIHNIYFYTGSRECFLTFDTNLSKYECDSVFIQCFIVSYCFMIFSIFMNQKCSLLGLGQI